MKIAFYIADGEWTDQLIRCWTNSFTSHVEIVFDDGWWFSSSPRDGGVRMKEIQIDPTVEPKHWLFFEVPQLSPVKEAAIRAWAEKISQDGIEYDMCAIILKFGLHLPVWDNPWKWICTEALLRALQPYGVLSGLPKTSTTPARMLQYVLDHGWNSTSGPSRP